MHSTRSFLLAGLLAAAGVGLLGASPAHAKREFENGFQDQLGRLAAYEVVRLGHFVLSGGHYAPYYHAPRPVYRHPRSYHPPRHHRHRGHHRPSWRSDHRGHDHHTNEPCDVEYEVRRRGPHGERYYERYTRRSRHHHDDDDDDRRWRRRVRYD